MQPGKRVRAAAAVAAALLAGIGTGWATAPDEPGPTRQLSARAAPVVPGDPTTWSASPATAAAERQRERTSERPSKRRHSIETSRPTTRPVPAPDRLEIPALGVSMPVHPVGVAADGQMALPQDPAVMGWYEHGSRPGELTGAAVLAAHRDMPGYGTGPVARLDELHAGDGIAVRSGPTVRRYRVVQVSRLAKSALDLDRLFARTGPPRLHLVTCAGAFDPVTRSYEQNLLVVAAPDA